MKKEDLNEVTSAMKAENIPADEQGAIIKLILLLAKKMIKERSSSGMILRDAHPKQIGLLKAEFIIEKHLPARLKKGIFETEKEYSAWVRLSNQNAPPRNDYKKDIRGMAIKVIETHGRKSLNEDANLNSQDFILISTDVFVTRNIGEFAGLISALVAGPLKLALYFLTHPKNLFNFCKSNKRFGSLLDARFFSVAPYAFDKEVVKYSVSPRDSQITPIPLNASSTPNYLTQVLEKQLTERDFYFDFTVQFQKEPKNMPIEDLSVRWKEKDSPFIKVATLKIPKQQFNFPEQNEYGEQLSFAPWNSLQAHMPLGGINRARKIIYKVLSNIRHSSNLLK